MSFTLTYSVGLETECISALLGLLDAEEQGRCRGFRVPSKQVESVIGRAFMRRVLGALLGRAPEAIRLSASRHGKPMLATTEREHDRLWFNLSHSKGHVLLAVSTHGEVGADVEAVGPYKPAVARRLFHAAQVTWLEQLPPADRAKAFCRLWTIREACAKAIGLGLPAPMRDLCALPAMPARSGAWRGLRWEMLDLGPAAAAAVALRTAPGADVPETWPQRRLSLRWLLEPAP